MTANPTCGQGTTATSRPVQTQPSAPEVDAAEKEAKPTETKVKGVDKTAVKALPVVVTGVTGMVQVRQASNRPWRPAKVGQMLGVGAEFRTGPRSAVQFRIGPTQTVTLDRLGTIKVLDAVRRHERITTDVGMKYGRTRYAVEAAGVEHESTIHSPGATLAVRGTEMGVELDPFDSYFWCLTGRTVLERLRLGRVTMSRQASMALTDRTPAHAAQRKTKVRPKTMFSALTDSEEETLTQNPGLGGTDIREFQSTKSRVGTIGVKRELKFSLFWFDGLSGTTDVDLEVQSPVAEILSENTLAVPSGGVHNGNTMGLSGKEEAAWLNKRPGGRYAATARLVTPFDEAKAFVIVKLDFKEVQGLECGSLAAPIQLNDQVTSFTCAIRNVGEVRQ